MARGIEQVGLEGLGLDRMKTLLVEALRGWLDLDDGVQRDGDLRTVETNRLSRV